MERYKADRYYSQPCAAGAEITEAGFDDGGAAQLFHVVLFGPDFLGTGNGVEKRRGDGTDQQRLSPSSRLWLELVVVVGSFSFLHRRVA